MEVGYTLRMFIPSSEIAEEAVARFGTPLFLTDEAALIGQVRKMRDAFGTRARIFYAIKANYNPHIVSILKEAGIDGIDAVSAFEVRLAQDIGFAPRAIAYTPSSPSTDEIRTVGEAGVTLNLGSLSELARYAELFPGKDIAIRICPEVGAGEFAQVTTGGMDSKFGLPLGDLPEARRLCEEKGLTIVGIHSHIGSGFYEPGAFERSVEAVCRVAGTMPTVRFIDVGGGFGVPYREEQSEVDLGALAAAAFSVLDRFEEATGRTLELRLEPGKYLVSGSTALIARITTIKEKGERLFVGLDTGFNHLVRPAMYGAYHPIVNLGNPDGAKRKAQVVGNLCESGDILNHDIELAEPREGDLVAILVAGGYGTSMSSTYNMRPRASEALHAEGNLRVTRQRQSYEDIVSAFEPYG